SRATVRRVRCHVHTCGRADVPRATVTCDVPRGTCHEVRCATCERGAVQEGGPARTTVHPANGLTVAHAGVPSRPVPGTRVSSSVRPDACVTIAGVIPVSGILIRRVHGESVWPAIAPTSR